MRKSKGEKKDRIKMVNKNTRSMATGLEERKRDVGIDGERGETESV